jgi:cation:H+ antiporter
MPTTLAVLVYGLAIVGAAFALSWAAEAAQVDISAGLVTALPTANWVSTNSFWCNG